jgi:hypothetical protein
MDRVLAEGLLAEGRKILGSTILKKQRDCRAISKTRRMLYSGPDHGTCA